MLFSVEINSYAYNRLAIGAKTSGVILFMDLLQGSLRALGLSIGFAVCTLIALFVHHHLSFDQLMVSGLRLSH
jgi:hypothetical protein